MKNLTFESLQDLLRRLGSTTHQTFMRCLDTKGYQDLIFIESVINLWIHIQIFKRTRATETDTSSQVSLIVHGTFIVQESPNFLVTLGVHE